MAQKLGKDYLQKAASGQDLVKAVKAKKAERQQNGNKVVLWKFIRQVFPNYKFYKFHATVIEQLQRVLDGECNRLILQVPPRHGKSLLASQLLPAAYLLAHPERFVGISSYSAELAEGFSRKARDYYREAGGLLNPSSQAVNAWGTEGGGGLWAAGVGGAITGRSGHLLIIDDPVKNREDAESPRMMEKLNDWYTSTLYTRLEPHVGAIVVIQTRWSENDMIGQLLENEMNVSEKGRENWTIVDLPALYEDEGDRPILPPHCETVPDWRTEVGQALCPQRYDVDDLERIREAVGSRDFASLYQQRPAPEGGNMFDPEWWQYYNHDSIMPNFQRVMLAVDATFTATNKSDYVVGIVVGQAGSQFYVLDLVREKLDV
ncbi:MAG: terminase large subunit domain-containing protein, partial [Pontimonas sp.]